MSSDGTSFATAVLTCCQQSHAFDDRRIPLTAEPHKVGRSVAKLRAATENAIFDCKVLSRNHALLWYEDGKFFLKDTKSSNGTFVNNQRLSKGSEESAPKEIFSCDIIQFGVDIVENKKITHGCIVAMVRLFHPDGSEAETRSSQYQPAPAFNPDASMSISGANIQELYQLQQFVKEAAHREQLLEAKLATLLSLLESSQQASNSSWQALIDEDRLLSRIETLEAQLSAYAKNMTEDKMREELQLVHEEREKFDSTAKESLRAALQEKIEAMQKLADVERSLETTEEECSRLKAECDFAQSELDALAQKHSQSVAEIRTLTARLEEAEQRYSELETQTENEKAELQARLVDMSKQENILTARIELMESDNDFTKEQLAAAKVRLEQARQQFDAAPLAPSGRSLEMELQTMENSLAEETADRLRESLVQVETFRTKLEESVAELHASRRLVSELQVQLDDARMELAQSSQRATTLEDKILGSNVQINRMIETATEDLRLQLNETQRQKELSDSLCRRLEDEVTQKENILKTLRTMSVSASSSGGSSGSNSPSVSPSNTLRRATHQASSSYAMNGHYTSQDGVPNVPLPTENGAALRRTSSAAAAINGGGDDEASWPPDPCDVATLQQHLAKAVQAKLLAESEVVKYREQLELSRSGQHRSEEEALAFRRQLQDAQNQLKLRSDTVKNLQDQLQHETERRKEAIGESDTLRTQFQESQQQLNNWHTEEEQLKNKLRLLTEELEFERSLRSTSNLDNDNARIALHRQAAKNQAEFAVLKDECASLRNRIVAIEREMKMSRKENSRLSTEYQRLQESYRNLERLKDSLETSDFQTARTPTDAESVEIVADTVANKQDVPDVHEEVEQLRRAREQQEREIRSLREKLESEGFDFDYETLELRSQTIAVLSFLPLLVLFIAFVAAFLPFFSAVTATTDP